MRCFWRARSISSVASSTEEVKGFSTSTWQIGFQAGPGDLVVFRGRHDDADRIHLVEDFAVVGKAGDVEFFAGGGEAFGIGVGHADQFGIA